MGKIKTPIIILSIALIIYGLFIFSKTDIVQDILNPIPEGYDLAQTRGITFIYPEQDLVFVDNGFWDRELYERVAAEGEGMESDTMPFIKVRSVPASYDVHYLTPEKLELALEKVAIAEQQFGNADKFADIDTFNGSSDKFGYGHKVIGGKSVLWVHAHEKFDTTTYYFYHGGETIIFTTLSSNDENLSLVESMIEGAGAFPRRIQLK